LAERVCFGDDVSISIELLGYGATSGSVIVVLVTILPERVRNIFNPTISEDLLADSTACRP